MSDSNKANPWTAVAGVAGLGVALGGLVYAGKELYDLYQNHSKMNETSTSKSRRSPSPEEKRQRSCPVCRKNLDSDFFILDCLHKFHTPCIKGSYILHMNEEVFKCPYDLCHKPVSASTITRLLDD